MHWASLGFIVVASDHLSDENDGDINNNLRTKELKSTYDFIRNSFELEEG